jgi:hypothetical protein
MYRTRYIALLVALSAKLCFALPSGTYSSSRYRFSFSPPAGWIAESHPAAVAVFIEPSEGHSSARRAGESNREFIERVNRTLKEGPASGTSFRANLTISAEKVASGTTAEQYSKTLFGRVEGVYKYRLLGRKPAKLGGLPAELLSVRMDPGDGSAIIVRDLVVVRGENALSFAVSSAPASSARLAAEFDSAMATLKWK